MSGDYDPYSAPVGPSWVSEEGGARFTVHNRSVREPYAIPRAERALEITCNGRPIAIVHPRGRPHDWRLQVLDEDQHLLRRDDPGDGLARAHYRSSGELPPADLDRLATFKCVCGRLHVLDRDAIVEAAERMEPRSRSAPARRIDFRKVAREIRKDPPLDL